MKTFIAWRPDCAETRADGLRFLAGGHRQAATMYAKRLDAFDGAYDIARGNPIVVHIATDSPRAQERRFEVIGRMQPYYCARRIVPDTGEQP